MDVASLRNGVLYLFFCVLADGCKTRPPGSHQLVRVQRQQAIQSVAKCNFKLLSCTRWIAVRATERFGNDAVDQT